MNRLTQLLLAGTMVPALVLSPFTTASAQAPDLERHGPGGAPGGAPHGGAAPPREAPPAPRAPAAMAPPAAPRAAAPVERAVPPSVPRAPAAQVPREAPHQAQVPHNAAESPRTPVQRAPQPAEAPARQPAAERPIPVAPKAERPTPATPKAERATPAAPKVERATPPSEAIAPRVAPQANPAPTRNEAVRPPTSATPGTSPRENAVTPNARPPAAEGNRPNAPAAQGRAPGGAPGNAGNPPGGPNNAARDNNRGGISPGGAAAIGAAAGFAGGFLAATGAQSLEGVRRDRREVVEDGRTYIREPGRTIVEDGDRSYIVHDENDRFRELGYKVDRQRRGDDFVDIIDRPDGTQILTYTTPDGRMLRRVRRYRDGREFVLIDNGYNGRVRPVQDDIVVLPPPPLDIPRDRYDVVYQDADEGLLYDTFSAPPLRAPPRRYTLDQIRYSPDIRRYVRSVDINTINFDSGSWIVPGVATGKLEALASAIKRTLQKDPNSVFLVEGFTDATGNPTDNLSLSDRRAQSVAAILSKSFGVPPENLTTQGYGQQNLKENTQGPSAANRRVVVQNITPLLAAGGETPR